MDRIAVADISELSGYGCSGRAGELIIVKNLRELTEVLSELRKTHRKWRVIGSGYNTLINDPSGGLVLVKLAGDFTDISVEGNIVAAGAAVSLSNLLGTSMRHGLSGLEFIAGIPGTVGGAVCGNAGAGSENISGILRNIEVYDAHCGDVSVIPASEIGFGYRMGFFSEDSVIMKAIFYLKTGNKTDIINIIRKNYNIKAASQPLGEKSCGSVFKNPEPQKKAWELVRSCGLAGERIGGAQVSEAHANFIVNTGNATVSDVWELIKRVRSEVERKSGIRLELEINLLGDGFED